MIHFTLPWFNNIVEGQKSLWELQAAKMRNYMNYLILHHNFKPTYYNIFEDKNDLKVILGDHVAHFYGGMMTQTLSNNTSIHN